MISTVQILGGSGEFYLAHPLPHPPKDCNLFGFHSSYPGLAPCIIRYSGIGVMSEADHGFQLDYERKVLVELEL